MTYRLFSVAKWPSQIIMSLCFMLAMASSHSAYALFPFADSQGEPLPSLAPMLKKVNPAVVNISTYTTRKMQQNPLLNDPFFRRFFNIPEQQMQQPQQRRTQSAGSGVIIDAEEGTVLTNHHVIDGADEITVAMEDGRSFTAKLIGSDPELDIAVLKIEGEDLVEVKVADSDQLQVGDFVAAIGNPFGLGQTVTTGIVSALGRTGLGIEGYENFIQTDASINPGNSGGALVNLRGELVGINTAILAPSGGNVGIGFAIPVNMARASIGQILEYGEVRRGQLGVVIQDLTPELAEAFDIDRFQRGAMIAEIQEDSAADKAGLETGDVVIEIDGKPVLSSAQLRNAVGVRKIGDKIKLKVLREGKEKTIKATLAEPEKFSVAKDSGAAGELLKGATLRNADDGNAVLIEKIEPGSPAASSGLRPGDLIVSVNRQRVSNVEAFAKAAARSNDRLLLRIVRGRAALWVVLNK
ncbi:periplasmic serine protease, Do/DeqQ family [Spongiibacter sp. IMCC21906]|uniref:DegQ family serine endoprotease n=1 Tax=Spongiibacter sp. IMCC21906 TaxID=1620392 RepID=UPI00062DEB2A|nr:DegQ family serine endoprotease [Spongiibacter sp. IMCC21906]AKH69757.1 periplasmic serine protease, Do/DeqQ family [Spongiibacter sp. IMCC21906]